MRTTRSDKKRNTHPRLNADLLDKAKVLNINLSAAVEQAMDANTTVHQHHLRMLKNAAENEIVNQIAEDH